MDEHSTQKLINVPAIGKKVNVYHYGDSPRKVLLVHGWSGRGTQLCSIADKLLKAGYSTVSFDAPAHGRSPGKTSDMTEFIAAILELDKRYGPFEYAVGHSLGAMAVLNSIKQGLKVQKAVIIGSGDVIEDIMNDFAKKLGMDFATAQLMIKLFEKKFNTTINSYSAYIAAQSVKIPVLMFHDEEDTDVPVTAAANIYSHLENGELIITHGLGHRKILGDSKVIKRIVEFLITNNEQNTDTAANVIADGV
jgi:pimeloyl-ACP methyl ester carboxylesterase